jgi:hypothetical protein
MGQGYDIPARTCGQIADHVAVQIGCREHDHNLPQIGRCRNSARRPSAEELCPAMSVVAIGANDSACHHSQG